MYHFSTVVHKVQIHRRKCWVPQHLNERLLNYNPWKNDIFYYNFIIKMSGSVSYAHLLWCLFSLFCSRSVCEAFRCSGSGFLSAWRLHYVQRVSISLPVILIYLWISQWRAELTLCLCAAKLWLRPQIQFVFGCQRWRRVVLSASWDTRSVLFY